MRHEEAEVHGAEVRRARGDEELERAQRPSQLSVSVEGAEPHKLTLA